MFLKLNKRLNILYRVIICTLCIGSVESKDGMVLVKATDYRFHLEYRWVEGLTLDSLVQDYAGIRYSNTSNFKTSGFYIDKTEVTNAQFKEFMDESGYKLSLIHI